MIDTHGILIVAAGCLVTAATRFLPFLIFRKAAKTPPLIEHLSKVLPCAIMGMLVVYCLKDASWLSYPYGIPEILGCLAVAGLHLWRRNTLLSIGAGTAFYMLLLQFVFPT